MCQKHDLALTQGMKIPLPNFDEELSSYLEDQIQQMGHLEERTLYSKQGRSELYKERYLALLDTTSGLDPEKILESVWCGLEFAPLKLPLYTQPHFYQKLPRYINSEDKGMLGLKKEFCNLKTLQRCCMEKALFYLYGSVGHDAKARIGLFTYVMDDGLGDFYAQQECFHILQPLYPNILRCVVAPRKYQVFFEKEEKNCMFFFYEAKEDLTVAMLPSSMKNALKNVDFLLQIPTYFPEWEHLVAECKPLAHYTVGEYGFIDSCWAHPEKKNTCCMGLHFLEKGIFIKEMPQALVRESFSLDLQKALFEEKTLPDYLEQRDFCFAYLKTEKGARAFLSLLLHYYEKSIKDIDLVTTDCHLFLQVLHTGFSLKKYGIKELRLSHGQKNFIIPVSSNGKVLRIVEHASLSSSDAQALLVLSRSLVACRGDQSFSEAVSASALFFYDGAPHAGPFLADLVAIARVRLTEYPTAHRYLQIIKECFEEKDLGCFENYGKEMALLLAESSTRRGLQLFMQILQEEYSFNKTLVHIVQRGLFHTRYPSCQKQEELFITQYQQGEISLSLCLNRIKELIQVSR